MLTAPRARREPHVTVLHGETLSDDYFWLRDREHPEVLAYLEAENAYAEAVLAHTQALREQLYTEMRARIPEIDASVPARQGAYLYYRRFEAGRQYPFVCRKGLEAAAAEEVLLDLNSLAQGHDFCELGACVASPDGALLAYTLDTRGDEVFSLSIKDLASGELLPDSIAGVFTDLAWANDSRTLFYTTLDPTYRPYRLYRHRVGDDPGRDALVFEEADAAFYLLLQRCRSGQYLTLTLEAASTTEVLVCPADRPEQPWQPIEARRHGHEYRADHLGEHWLIVTNDRHPNFRLVCAPALSPGAAAWRELVPPRPDVLLDAADAFRDFVVLHERVGGLRQLRCLRPDGAELGQVNFPEAAYRVEPDENHDFDASCFRFRYSSFVTPETLVDYQVAEGRWQMLKQDVVPGHDPASYQVERLEAIAADGARVPISIVYGAGFQRDGRGPLLLHGYGAYGAVLEPEFKANRLSLLERGWAYAIAHVRGGSDLGRSWYEQGRLLSKRNTFTDMIACAEHLIAEGYSSSTRMALIGTSAGGLLVGATVTMRPDLFQAAIARVPFVDVITTMLDPSLPLVVNEWEQWGNPAEPTQFAYMRSYSPYDNVRAGVYPHLLITAGLNDPRVCVHEPAKWAARLRATKTGEQCLLLRTNMGAGHAGSSGRFDVLRELAFEYAFLLDLIPSPTHPLTPSSSRAASARS
jgi:oligopeptidase B